MRVLLLLLLSLNASFFLWHYVNQQDTKLSDELDRVAGVPHSERSLVLLAEREISGVVDGQPPTPLKAESVKRVASPVRVCYLLGPLEDAGAVDNLLKLFEGSAAKERMTQKEVHVLSGYRVHLPAFHDFDQARKVLDRLKRQGIEDIAAVRLDNGDYLVSLGFFRLRTSADRRIIRLNKLGYDARLEERYRKKSVYWLDLAVDERLFGKLWPDIDTSFPGLTRQTKDCP